MQSTHPARGLLFSVLLAASLLAGCSSAKPPQAASPGADEAAAGSALAAAPHTLTAADSLAAPAPWKVGDWFGVHVFVGMDDTEGRHYNTIVVKETSDAWLLASDDKEAAKEEGAFDYPILGSFAKSNLGTTGLGGRWDLMQFPLTNGSTWKSKVALDPTDASQSLDLEFEAKFNGKIPTATGPKPGYDIIAVDGNARQVLSFDYVPDVGWFTRFVVFDTSTEDPLDYFISARSMGTGHDWKGTYYVDTGKLLVQHFNFVGVDPANPTQPYTQAQPTSSFTVSDAATYLYGFVFSFSFAGAHDVILLGPDHQPREVRSYDLVVAGESPQVNIDEAAVPGAWSIYTVGAGVVAGGGAFLWEITEVSGTL